MRANLLLKSLIALILALVVCQPATAQSRSHNRALGKGMAAITRTNAEANLHFLASDAMGGRWAGSTEGKIAAEFIVTELRKMGYTPQRQPFTGRNGQPLQNILVTLPGEDTLKQVIAGAHYDHEGTRNGDIYNGADDNASGTVAVLELARALRAGEATPRHTIILAFWDGEERGLQGSRHYAGGIEDTTAVLYYMNFDMVGRNTDEERPGLFRYFYTDSHPRLRTWLDEGIVRYNLSALEPDYRPWDNPTSGSDNASFARRGIPIVWFHTDGHPDFHKPTDTAEKINYPKLLDITRAAYYILWQMANQ